MSFVRLSKFHTSNFLFSSLFNAIRKIPYCVCFNLANFPLPWLRLAFRSVPNFKSNTSAYTSTHIQIHSKEHRFGCVQWCIFVAVSVQMSVCGIGVSLSGCACMHQYYMYVNNWACDCVFIHAIYICVCLVQTAYRNWNVWCENLYTQIDTHTIHKHTNHCGHRLK